MYLACNLHGTNMRFIYNVGVAQIQFSFLDPVYVWIRQAELLVEKGEKLVWKPKILRQQPSNEPMYGSGIEYGELLLNAASSVPQGGHAALMNLSWDSGSTNMKSRSAVPICLQAGYVCSHAVCTYPTCNLHASHI